MAKILLVEDDNNLREIFEMRLQAEGYQTVTASNGEEGLVVAMKEKPDLLVADVMMPKLSGFEMLETLRSSPETKDIKAIMMTALGQAEDQARGERVGVLKYLVKSQITLEDFVRVIREVLEPGNKGSATDAPANGPPPSSDSSSSNKQESENTMPDDTTTPASPTPGADAPAPSMDSPAPAPTDAPATNPISGDEPTSAPADDSQQTTAQEQSAVQGQIDNFASNPAPTTDTSAPAPGLDTPAPAPTDAPATDTTIPVSTPPADSGFPPATPGSTTAPTTPNDSTPPTGGTI